LIPNPIHKVLSTLCTHEVRHLLMGGQACVFYGAAEFSRDCDIVIVCDEQNLARLRAALDKLQAHTIAVPPFDAKHLERGHAVHFRCQAPDAEGMRIDVMARLRGVASFEELWSRRTTIEDATGVRFELMSLADLVAAKKTQRDKDWPMLRRLVEAHFAQHEQSPTDDHVRFWLRESRTREMLLDVSARYPDVAKAEAARRPLLMHAIEGDRGQLESALAEEQRREHDADRHYWKPLQQELEQMRHRQSSGE
jgi:hypothetical protein